MGGVVGATQLFGYANSDLSMVLLELQYGITGNEIGLPGFRHCGRNFVRTIGDDRIESENFALISTRL